MEKTKKRDIKAAEKKENGEKKLFKKANKDKSGVEGKGNQPVLNRRQKQKVSDLVKTLRVSQTLPFYFAYRSTTAAC